MKKYKKSIIIIILILIAILIFGPKRAIKNFSLDGRVDIVNMYSHVDYMDRENSYLHNEVYEFVDDTEVYEKFNAIFQKYYCFLDIKKTLASGRSKGEDASIGDEFRFIKIDNVNRKFDVLQISSNGKIIVDGKYYFMSEKKADEFIKEVKEILNIDPTITENLNLR